VDKRSEVVLLHDVGRNVFCRDAHVFVAIHGRAEVKKSMSAVSKATDFSRGSCKPEFAVLAQFELGILHGGAGAGINNGVCGPKGMGRQGGMGGGLWCGR